MTPNFEVSLDGSDQTDTIRPLLSKIEVFDKAGVDADVCDITLKATESVAIPASGTDVEVKLGFRETSLWEVFKGVANRVGYSGPPDLLHIQATGIALSDDKRLQSSHVRSWNEATLGDIVTDIIQVAGFKARVHDSLSSIEIKRHIQSIETDIEVLTQLMTLYGGVLKSDGETVAVVPRDSLERASGGKLASVTVKRGECVNYSYSQHHRQGYKTVVAFWQDETEMGATRAYIEGTGEPELRLKTIFSTEDAATKAARKELAKVKQIHTFRASMVGRFVAVGSPLKVDDFPKQLDRDYQVVNATHSYGRGYVVEIEAEGE